MLQMEMGLETFMAAMLIYDFNWATEISLQYRINNTKIKMNYMVPLLQVIQRK